MKSRGGGGCAFMILTHFIRPVANPISSAEVRVVTPWTGKVPPSSLSGRKICQKRKGDFFQEGICEENSPTGELGESVSISDAYLRRIAFRKIN